MRITIDGKRVWPPLEQKHPWSFSKFVREPDGGLLYLEFPADANGKPDEGHPNIVVEIDKEQTERLALKLRLDETRAGKTSKEKRVRRELLATLNKLDQIRKEQGEVWPTDKDKVEP